MSEPTICAKCKHIKPHGVANESDDYYGLAMCDAALESRRDYVSGGIKRKKREGDYETCDVRNKTGECPDYEAKEVEHGS